MKQQITKSQFNKLLSKSRSDLRLWLISKGYQESLFGEISIGQMIEFLYENAKRKRNIPTLQWIDENLCDLLWKEVVEVLEQI